MSKIKLVLAVSLVSVLASIGASTAWAQAATGSSAAAPGDIVVTARKRAEDILKTPVAVSVVTSQDIEKRGIVSLSDLAANTPGVTINNNSSGRADRSFQQIIIRGFTPSTSLATTVSTFIDGAPVSSPTALTTISDPARIETLKGPQSAYFGRNTFAGAVNIVNKEPSDHWGGELLAMGGVRNSYRLHAALEGPIVGDKLTFRIAGDQFGKDGAYRNLYTGQTLGDQSSKSVNGLLVAKPLEGLTVKLFGLYSEDHDGPAAQGLIGAYQVSDAATGRTVVVNQSNCILNGVASGTVGTAGSTQRVLYPSFCGVAPGLSAVAPSANTVTTPQISNFLANSTGRIFSGANGVQNYGLLRRFHHMHAAIDYQIADTGLTLSSITSGNGEGYSTLVDLKNYGSSSFDFPYLIERRNNDFSQEVRLGFDNGGPLKATVGGSYLNNWIRSDLGGPSVGGVTSAGMTKSKTLGGFFALSYKFFDRLTVNAEGRYQSDKLYAYTDTDGHNPLTQATYNNFLPRAIAQFDVSRNTMLYASWAKGVNPGQFNTSFLTSPPATVAAAQAAGINVQVRPEKVTNYEVGIKGKLLDGHLRYALDGYYAQWRDQINTIALALLDPNTGVPQLVQGTANTGSVNMKGIEFDGSYVVSSLITLNAAAALNDSNILSYASPTVSKLTGIFDYSGKQMANTSKWSATAGIQFGGKVRGPGNATWFARADYAYKSGVWSNAANIVRTPDYHNVNLRVGTTIDRLSLDLFVNNVFNNLAYTSIGDQFVFTPNFAYTSTNSALIVGLREKRSAGIQAKLKF